MPAGVRRGVAPRFVAVPKPQVSEPSEPDTVIINKHNEIAIGPQNVHYTERFASPQTGSVSLVPATVEDLDRLWDWARSDRDGVAAFLGQSHLNSRTYFAQIHAIAVNEQKGAAWLRSIHRGDDVVGFVCLDPIVRVPVYVGTCHIYVAPEARGSLPDIVPHLLACGDAMLPGITFMVCTDRDEWSTLLKTVGFSAKTVLTRLPPGA